MTPVQYCLIDYLLAAIKCWKQKIKHQKCLKTMQKSQILSLNIMEKSWNAIIGCLWLWQPWHNNIHITILYWWGKSSSFVSFLGQIAPVGKMKTIRLTAINKNHQLLLTVYQQPVYIVLSLRYFRNTCSLACGQFFGGAKACEHDDSCNALLSLNHYSHVCFFQWICCQRVLQLFLADFITRSSTQIVV